MIELQKNKKLVKVCSQIDSYCQMLLKVIQLQTINALFIVYCKNPDTQKVMILDIHRDEIPFWKSWTKSTREMIPLKNWLRWDMTQMW